MGIDAEEHEVVGSFVGDDEPLAGGVDAEVARPVAAARDEGFER